MSRPGAYRICAHERALDHLRVGWCFADRWDLGPVHGHWSVMLFWPCSCAPVEPLGETPA